MDNALDHLDAQLEVEEGNRALIYDDATGKPFKKGDTLKGNLSAGIGINLMVPFAPEELAFLEKFRIAKVQARSKPMRGTPIRTKSVKWHSPTLPITSG